MAIFDFLKKNKEPSVDLLAILEDAEATARRAELYCILPALAETFALLDNPSLRLAERQVMQIRSCIVDIKEHSAPECVPFDIYITERIREIVEQKGSHVREANAEYDIRKCDAELAMSRAQLEVALREGDDVKVSKLEYAIATAERERAGYLEEYRRMKGDNHG